MLLTSSAMAFEDAITAAAVLMVAFIMLSGSVIMGRRDQKAGY